jgi:hypothetical protein
MFEFYVYPQSGKQEKVEPPDELRICLDPGVARKLAEDLVTWADECEGYKKGGKVYKTFSGWIFGKGIKHASI